MLRTTGNPVRFSLTRGGGARILAQVDVWKATQTGWELVGLTMFADAGKTLEDKPLADKNGTPIDRVAPGQYTARFRAAVTEQLAVGGTFQFDLAVAGVSTFADQGDVNTTPSADDARRYDDLFTLVVT
jgi:hypothetical protein